MTQEATRALEILKLGKKYKKELREIKKQNPLIDPLDPKNPVNEIVMDIYAPYADKLAAQDMVLFEYCMDHPSIQAEFEAESKKLEAKIKAQREKQLKENKDKLDCLKTRIDDAKIKETKRDRVRDFVRIAMGCLIAFWIITYVVLLIVLPTQSIVHRLLIEGILLIGILPVVGLIFLRIFITSKVEDWAYVATKRRKSAEQDYEDAKADIEKSVAHLVEQLKDYKFIIGVTTGKMMPII
jgi:hypothetical protein